MKGKTGFFVFTVLCMFLVFAGTAMATPGKSVCSGCHDVDAAVMVDVTFVSCSGSDATYDVIVSDTYDAAEGWAVFDGGSNLANGLSPGTFTVPAGVTYDVWGVSDSDMGIGGGKGGSNVIVIAPDCGPACTDSDNDGYYAESGCGTPGDCDDSNPDANPGALEVCTGNVDEDCDGTVDCLDGDCTGDPACVTCTDDDSDGYAIEGGDCGPVDCNDTDPFVNPGAVEDCFNGIDDDCDNLIDDADPDCDICTDNEKGLCADGIDNDCDNVTDCDDRDCRRDAACQPDAEICDNGIDDDNDGKTDCSDRDCRRDPACSGSAEQEICDDGIDNDGDGKTDCADKKDCGKDPACN